MRIGTIGTGVIAQKVVDPNREGHIEMSMENGRNTGAGISIETGSEAETEIRTEEETGTCLEGNGIGLEGLMMSAIVVDNRFIFDTSLCKTWTLKTRVYCS
ncbi:hypothetical protein AG1IA_04728 [Rhizoctonia solani AG-1 IA]|uniref:Uncharacterized protein n=1 Tax=Thanatephorus cucumeris (strain AG1-IA) TaxID=983506 RepID=L8WTE3_THACA|nr:hypothetical protein AG1IA_04728 [Rhizoctonia solani AG-1 IA]